METKYLTPDAKKEGYRGLLRTAEQQLISARINAALEPESEGARLTLTRALAKLEGFEKLADLDAPGARSEHQKQTSRYLTLEELENLCFNALIEAERRVCDGRTQAFEQNINEGWTKALEAAEAVTAERQAQLQRLEELVDQIVPDLRRKKALPDAPETSGDRAVCRRPPIQPVQE